VLRQTAIALMDGSTLSDHENPGEATLQVLVGRVRLTWSAGSVDLDTGGHVVIPHERHGLLALTDAVVLLTAAKA
jgi:quercetin dioxygenase-like cupin family protein